MARIRITCITQSIPHGGHEHITHAGNASGVWPVKLIVHNIDNNINSFFVRDDWTGKTAEVGVVRPNYGRRPYIRTYADGVYTDNLLSLTACPWRAAA